METARLRQVLCSLALLSAACAAERPGRQADSGADGLIDVRVCNSATSGTQVVAAYGLEKGIFAKHGLAVTLIPITSGSRAVAAMVSGGVQLCQISGSAVAHAIVAGADLAIIGAVVDRYAYSLIVSAGIRSPADLKGKAVAISTAGSGSETAMRVALRALGLQPNRDVAILAIGSQPERMAALQAGYVAGTLLSFPETTLARSKGFHVLLDVSTIDVPNLHTGIAVSKAFLKTDRSTVLRFMKAMTETIFSIKNDKAGAVAVLSKYMQLDPQRDAAALEETYEALLKRKLVDIPYPSLAGIDSMLTEIERENPSAQRFTPERIADLSIVRELETSGFFKDLFGRK